MFEGVLYFFSLSSIFLYELFLLDFWSIGSVLLNKTNIFAPSLPAVALKSQFLKKFLSDASSVFVVTHFSIVNLTVIVSKFLYLIARIIRLWCEIVAVLNLLLRAVYLFFSDYFL